MHRTFYFLPLLLAAALAGGLGWHFGRQRSADPASVSTTAKVLFYQSPMHPWIKSDKPGNCTICGMKLVPVFEGGPASEAHGDAAAVALTPQSLEVVKVASAPVKREVLQRTIRVAGKIDDDDTKHRRLSATVEGRIDQLFTNFVGAEVTAGQPLAAIYSRELLVARSEYTLAVKQSSSPDRDIAVAASRQKLRRLGLTLEQIEKLPGQTGDTFEIVAPVSGTVVERKVYAGQYVKEGDVLFEIADFTKMWFVFDLYERDLAWVRVGQPVEVVTPSVPGKIFTAPIEFIDPTLVTETRTAKVRVVLENPLLPSPEKHRRELLHKTYADGRIRVESEPVLTVPRTAVLSPGGVPAVYVEKSPGAYEPRRVTLGRVGDEVWEVVAGLSEGERVVTTGNLLIDAQAQLDHGTSAPMTGPPLTDEQRSAARGFFEALAGLGAALAADDLASFNAKVPAAQSAAQATVAQWGEQGRRLGTAAPLAQASDLHAARKVFYPLSTAATELAAQLRRADHTFDDFKIFACPMAQSAVPTALTAEGRWLQIGGPLRNPYFGAEMLTCGEEVKP